MRNLVRIAAGLVALLVVGGIALAVMLPDIIEAADLRGTFDQLAREQIGRSLEYGEVDIGILPPRLEVSDLVIGGAEEGAPPAVRARRAALDLAWRPLFSGKAVVDALVIDGAELRMVRTAAGIDLLAAAVPAAPAASAAAEESSGESAVSLRRVSLRDSRIVFDDRLASPPVVWELTDVRIDATGGAAGGSTDFTLAAALASGGDVRGQGRVGGDGSVEAEVELADFTLSPIASYVEALDRLSGTADLEADVVRAADGSADVDLRIESDDLDVISGDTTAAGAASVTAELHYDAGVLTGPYTIDLTDATLELGGGAVKKAAGEPGRLEGTLRVDDAGAASDFRLQLRNLAADGSLKTSPALRLELSAPAFELAGWEATIPALEDAAPRGELRVERLVYTAEPERLTGSVELRSLFVEQGDDLPPLEISGFVDARGTSIALRETTATLGAARVSVSGGVSDLFGVRDVSVRIQTPEPIESNDVFSLVDSLRDAIFGALSIDLDLGLPLSGRAAEQPALERLNGAFSFQIGGDEAGGRLQGVSLLRQVFDRFGALGHAALLALPTKRGKSLDEYYSEQFSLAAGSFRIENGEARTNDLRIVYEKYRTNLRGGLRLDDLTLDMTGDVVISPEVDAALSGAEVGRERTIPLARVGGTLMEPKIVLRDEDVSRFVAYYALSKDSKLGKKIDKALGRGTSDLLRDILGGGRQ